MFLSGITVDFNWWNKPNFSCTVIKVLYVYQIDYLQGWLGNHSSDSPKKAFIYSLIYAKYTE